MAIFFIQSFIELDGLPAMFVAAGIASWPHGWSGSRLRKLSRLSLKDIGEHFRSLRCLGRELKRSGPSFCRVWFRSVLTEAILPV